MSCLGIDIGMKYIAVAQVYSTLGQKTPAYQTWMMPFDEPDQGWWDQQIEAQLEAGPWKHDGDNPVIVIEEQVHKKLARIDALAEAACRRVWPRASIYKLGPTRWKKLYFGDGKITKADITKWSMGAFPRSEGVSQHEQDALAMACLAEVIHAFELEPVPAPRTSESKEGSH